MARENSLFFSFLFAPYVADTFIRLHKRDQFQVVYETIIIYIRTQEAQLLSLGLITPPAPLANAHLACEDKTKKKGGQKRLRKL